MVATRAAAVSAAAVPIAFLAANATSYALLLVAAHTMSSADYGALSSLLSLLLISTIPMLALQTVAARRMAAGVGSQGLTRGTVQITAVATGTLCLISPALAYFLHLHNVTGIILVAATIPANAALGTAMGLAQGRRQFLQLAALIMAAIGGRSVGGLMGLLIGNSPLATLMGVLLGTTVTAAVVVTRRPMRDYQSALAGAEHAGVFRETLHAGHVHGTFILLTSLDVLLARHSLSSHDAGVYAVGSVVTRATVWLPQSVIMLMFASLAESHRHHSTARRASETVVGIGAVCVAGCALLGPLVVTLVGGKKYHVLDDTIWLYALLGALLAVVQLAILAGLAQRNPRRVALLWATITADVVLVLASDVTTPTQLVVRLVVVGAVAAIAAFGLTRRQVERSAGQGDGVYVGSSPASKPDASPAGTG